MRKRQNGFTLMELLTAVAMGTIIMGIAVPSVLEYLPRLRLNGASRQIMYDLVDSRMSAVKNACDVTLTFTRTGSYTIWTDTNRDGVQTADEVQSKSLADDFKGLRMYFTTPTIQFNSRGSTESFGSIILNNSEGYRIVSTNTVGRVKVYSFITS